MLNAIVSIGFLILRVIRSWPLLLSKRNLDAVINCPTLFDSKIEIDILTPLLIVAVQRSLSTDHRNLVVSKLPLHGLAVRRAGNGLTSN